MTSSSGHLKAGTYTGIQSVGDILGGADADNYSFVGTVDDYTVSKLPITDTAIAPVATTYGTQVAAGNVSFGNIVIGDQVSATASIVNPQTSTSGNLKAGSYSQTASALSNTDADNYSFSGFTTATPNYSVAKLDLTGTIAGGSSIYGSPLSAGTAC